MVWGSLRHSSRRRSSQRPERYFSSSCPFSATPFDFADMWNTGYICCPDTDPPRYAGITDDMKHRSWSCRRMGRRVCRWTFRMMLGARFHSRCFRRSLRKSGSSLGLEKNRMVLTTTEALSMEVNSGIRHCHGTDNSLPTGFLSLAAPDTRATQSPGCVCLRF